MPNHSSCALLSITLILSLSACERKTDEERIIEEINSTSVYLSTGFKMITANPDNDPDIANAQKTLHNIMDAVDARQQMTDPQDSFTLSELGQMAKIAYSAKQFGKEEVSKGRQSDFRFLATMLKKDNEVEDIPITVAQDHALTLAALFIVKLQPGLPVPITQKTLLYEAWMAGDAEFDSEHMTMFIRSVQASTFASNGFCDFALHHTSTLQNKKIEELDPQAMNQSLSMLLGFGRVMAHAPAASALAPIALLPIALELFPGIARIMAHIQTANCFSERGDDAEKFRQQHYAVDVLTDMGLPVADIALLKASLAYKQDDLSAAAEHLRETQNSTLLDARSKQDLLLLADSLASPDKSLVKRYFSSAALSLTAAKIINQRLHDEGFYDALYSIESVKRIRQMATGLLSVDLSASAGKGVDNAIKTGSGLLNKLMEPTE